jgi:superfamily I DNA/RNA helicase
MFAMQWPKRLDKKFIDAQRIILENAYRNNSNLNGTAEAGIAEELGVDKVRVNLSPFRKAPVPYILTAPVLWRWFQNRRQKARSMV